MFYEYCTVVVWYSEYGVWICSFSLHFWGEGNVKIFFDFCPWQTASPVQPGFCVRAAIYHVKQGLLDGGEEPFC